MELTMHVEPAGWGWLRFADAQMVLTVRASYVSDVMADVIRTIAEVASGAGSAETHLGLEPGEVTLRIERQDEAAGVVTLEATGGCSGPRGTFVFPVLTSSLPTLGLGLAASVDRTTYLDSWAPQGSWPTEALERLQRLARDD